MKLHLRFHPQAWQNDYAIPVDPEGDTEWWSAFDGVVVPDDDTYESDDLRYLPGAPQWVTDWAGPFYIEVLSRRHA